MTQTTQPVQQIEQTFDLLNEQLILVGQWAWLFKQAAVEMSSVIMKMNETEIKEMKDTFTADAQQYLLNMLHEGITNKTNPIYKLGDTDDQPAS